MRAPRIFFTALVGLVIVAAGLIWFVMDWRWAGVVQELERHINVQHERISAKDDQIAELGQKAGAVPALLERIQRLEERVFSESITKNPAAVNLFNGKWDNAPIGAYFEQSLADSGWIVDSQDTGPVNLSYDGPVIWSASPAAAETIKGALDAAGWKYQVEMLEQGEAAIIVDAQAWQAPLAFLPSPPEPSAQPLE